MTDTLMDLVKGWHEKKILVIGDLMLDKYVWADVSRISPEAPIQVAEVRSEGCTVGGAANVAHNIVTLGGKVALIGVVGKDLEGELLLECLQELGIETHGIVVDSTRPTTTKTRIIAQSQQVLRIDRERQSSISSKNVEGILTYIRGTMDSVDGVVLSDYGKGVLSEEVIALSIRLAQEGDRHLVVDPKGTDYTRYKGASIISPNHHELEMATGGKKLGSEEEIGTAAAQLLENCDLEALVVTRGKDGISVFEKSHVSHHIPTVAMEVVDVSGAGDTVISALTLGLTVESDIMKVARVANTAAGVVVRKVGTATVSPYELEAELSETTDTRKRKIVNVDELSRILSHFRNQGKVVVFTNGCFDLLHIGHLTYLQKAKQLGDVLAVGLNSDESVRSLKGPSRPLVSQDERMHLMAALDCVDFVVILDELTPQNMIAALRPDILVKGSDYTLETVVGRDIVESYGGRVELIQVVQEKSTTKMIAQILEKYQDQNKE